MKTFFTKHILWTLIVLGLVFKITFSLSPHFCEAVYGQVLYPAIATGLRALFGSVNFTAGYFSILLFLALLLLTVLRIRRKPNLAAKLLVGLKFILLWYIAFLFFWGFNYHRPTVEQRLELESASALPDSVFAHEIALQLIGERQTIAAQLHQGQANALLNAPYSRAELIDNVRQICGQLGYPPAGEKLAVRQLQPAGMLRRLGIAGIYNPFTGEGNVDKSYSFLPEAFTSAHEAAHACGVTHEGEANAIAWLACQRSTNAAVRYAGTYALWRYLRPYELNDSLLLSRYPKLDLVLLDQEALLRDAQKYPPLFPEFSEAMNNFYLKFNSVNEGVASYNRFTAVAWLIRTEHPELLNR